jgi:cytochrome c553
MRCVLTVIALIAALTGAATAQTRGFETLAQACMSCHGLDGRSVGTIPSLAGNDAAAIATSMRGFASGANRGTVMNYIAKGYTAEQIDALAAFFASRR